MVSRLDLRGAKDCKSDGSCQEFSDEHRYSVAIFGFATSLDRSGNRSSPVNWIDPVFHHPEVTSGTLSFED